MEIDKIAKSEANSAYKNSFIMSIAMQLIAVILIIVGRVLWNRVNHYEANLSVTIGAVTFYLVKKNNLLIKYPARTNCDKKYLNVILGCTYPLVLAVIIVFVALHGLSTIEQFISLFIFAAIAFLPFLVFFILNKKRKN